MTPETLPAADQPPPAALEKPLRILLAEDNHINQQVVGLMLAPLNCSVDVAGNGLEALEAVETRPYDLILMDVMMPEMDGPTATAAIRALADAERANTPIIALTANAMKGDRERYVAAGMNDYVPKPIDQDLLIRTILQVLDIPIPDTGADAPSAEPAAPAGPDNGPDGAADTQDAFADLMENFETRSGSAA